MRNIHWLLQGALPGKDAVLKSNLATIRLRAGPSAGDLAAGTAMTFGDHPPEDARLLLVGKYNPNDPSRHQRWMDAIRHTRGKGGQVWVDYTDNHVGVDTGKSQFYRDALQAADGAICPTLKLQGELKKFWSGRTEIIEDANDLTTRPPKTAVSSPRVLMWFGDPTNLSYLFGALGMLPRTIPLRLIIVTRQSAFGLLARTGIQIPGNVQVQFCPWSIENMRVTASMADACIIPADPADPRKNGASSNRLISALSLGLPVAADLLESYREFADYFVDIRTDRFEDLVADPLKYREMVVRAQGGIVQRFSVESITKEWGRFFNQSLEEIASH